MQQATEKLLGGIPRYFRPDERQQQHKCVRLVRIRKINSLYQTNIRKSITSSSVNTLIPLVSKVALATHFLSSADYASNLALSSETSLHNPHLHSVIACSTASSIFLYLFAVVESSVSLKAINIYPSEFLAVVARSWSTTELCTE